VACDQECGFRIVCRHLSLTHDHECENRQDVWCGHCGRRETSRLLRIAASERCDGLTDLHEDENVAVHRCRIAIDLPSLGR
jgi:hypothetical protein